LALAALLLTALLFVLKQKPLLFAAS